MARLLSNLVDNFVKGIHKIKCKYGHNFEKWKTYETEYKGCECCPEYTNAKDDLIEYKCFWYNKSYEKKLMKTQGRDLL